MPLKEKAGFAKAFADAVDFSERNELADVSF